VSNALQYEVIKNMPVARFAYKGTHSHPVRRTVLLIENTKEFLRGYELREGSVTRTMQKAPIKTYRRDRIAFGLSLRKNSPFRKTNPEKCTLVRKPLFDIVETGA
jgi:hypothetical protein